MTSFKSTLLLVAVMLSSCAAGGTTRPRGSVPARRRAGDHDVGQVDDPVVKVGAGNRASLEFAESARPTASRDCAQWGLRSPLSDSSAVSRSSWRPVFGPRRSCRGLGSGPAQSASDACPVGASTGVSRVYPRRVLGVARPFHAVAAGNHRGAYALSWAYAPHKSWSWGESNPRPSGPERPRYDHPRLQD